MGGRVVDLVPLLVPALPLVVLLRDELGGVAHGEASRLPADGADGLAIDSALGAVERRAESGWSDGHLGMFRRSRRVDWIQLDSLPELG